MSSRSRGPPVRAADSELVLPHALSVHGAHLLREVMLRSGEWLARGLRGEQLPPLVAYLMREPMEALCRGMDSHDFRLTLDFVWDVLLQARRDAPTSDILWTWAERGCRHAYALEKMAEWDLEMPAAPATWFLVRSPRCYELLQHRLTTADVNARDDLNATPLFYATNERLFSFFLERGADPLLLWKARTLPHPQSLRLALRHCTGFQLDPKRMLFDPEHAQAMREDYVALLHGCLVEIPRALIESCAEERTCHALLSYGYLSKVPGRLKLGLIRWHPRTHKFFWSPLLQQRILVVLMVLKRRAPKLPRDIRIHLLDLIMN